MKTNDILKCPICQNDMVKGYIPNFRDNIAWYPYNRKWRLKWRFRMAENSINLHNDEDKTYYCISYFCDHCKKIIIDIPEPEEDEIEKVFKGYTFDSKK
ncbi:hypothetical protein BN85409730 [Alteracholeplasma palmae J233]|uniref:DUF6487 domain-containing protein n=1 Tax=Alteracholeplasma palmae (strain ATCC 49389 / J233) TaxID=1318466 RepID=U4KQF3_ALTPJ|nr:PF20097 family protein [Alteracholeplasma palmae]CCV64550.1 hypothetical protein BN85409730 [Alteracholeplasma palmae J233]